MRFIKIKTGDLMQVHESHQGGVTYGSISIRLATQYTQIEEATQVLTEFLQQLQPTFAIQYSAGLEIRHSESRTTLTDYWRDAEDFDWKVRGYTNGAALTIRYIRNINDLPVGKEDFF